MIFKKGKTYRYFGYSYLSEGYSDDYSHHNNTIPMVDNDFDYISIIIEETKVIYRHSKHHPSIKRVVINQQIIKYKFLAELSPWYI